MDTISNTRRATEPRSGGKIVRERRTVPAKTPYDRPILPSPSQREPESPNWFASATRIIASGAGKLLSTVFSSDNSSSSGSYSDDDDLSSDDEVSGERSQEDAFYQQEENEPNQPFEEKSEAKRVIEQLLMQETFSREECDRLVQIVESRVLHIPVAENDKDGVSSEIPNTRIGSGPSSSAVMEARKWLKDKKSGSGSKSAELDLGTCTLNTAMLPDHTFGEVGSPVDVAKSYMRLRPPWASPTMNLVEVESPSPVTKNLFLEETPGSLGRRYLSSSKPERESLATESWKISEVLRRVRAKASEDLLGSLPSSKIDWSPISLERKRRSNQLTAETVQTGLETNQDGLHNGALSSTPDMLTSDQHPGIEAIRGIDGNQGSKEGNGLTCAPTTNGFTSSGPSLSTPLDILPDPTPSEAQLPNPVISSSERVDDEASAQAQLNETDNVGTISQNSSSSIQHDESAQNLNTNHANNSKGNTGEVVDKQGGKRPGRYSKKGRGRGK